MNAFFLPLARRASLLIAVASTCALAGCMTVNCNVKDACRSVPVPGSPAQSTDSGH